MKLKLRIDLGEVCSPSEQIDYKYTFIALVYTIKHGIRYYKHAAIDAIARGNNKNVEIETAGDILYLQDVMDVIADILDGEEFCIYHETRKHR